MSVVDLFAGPGGWDLAATRLGLDVLGIEWDDAACATRVAAGLRTLQADVAELDPFEFGDVAGLIASPPCQAFSMAGTGEGRGALDVYCGAVRAWYQSGHVPDRAALDKACDDERAHLVLEPLRWAEALRPEWVAFEQVEPVLPIWEAMAAALRSWGYSAAVGVLSAERYGVPQTRRRAILVAHRDRPVSLPEPTHQQYVVPREGRQQEESLFEAPEAERIVVPGEEGLLPWVSMAEALGWGMTQRPYPVLACSSTTGGPDKEKVGGSAARQAIYLEALRGAWVDGEEPGQRVENIPAHRRPEWAAHRPATTVACDARIFPPRRTDRNPGYRPGDPPQSQGNPLGSAIRVEIEEAGVLQTFPVDYPWQGTRTSRFQQIGNAIPPLLAQHILEAVAL